MISLNYFIRYIDKCDKYERDALLKAILAYADAIINYDIDHYNEIYDWYFWYIRTLESDSK